MAEQVRVGTATHANPEPKAPSPRVSVPSAAQRVIATTWEVLGAIQDPCSVAFGCPLSLVEMQLVKGIDYDGDRVRVMLQLTEPTCMYTFRIGDEIKAQLRLQLEPGTAVDVHLVPPDLDDVWTEDMIAGPARERLTTWRRQRALTARRQDAGQSKAHRPGEDESMIERHPEIVIDACSTRTTSHSATHAPRSPRASESARMRDLLGHAGARVRRSPGRERGTRRGCTRGLLRAAAGRPTAG